MFLFIFLIFNIASSLVINSSLYNGEIIDSFDGDFCNDNELILNDIIVSVDDCNIKDILDETARKTLDEMDKIVILQKFKGKQSPLKFSVINLLSLKDYVSPYLLLDTSDYNGYYSVMYCARLKMYDEHTKYGYTLKLVKLNSFIQEIIKCKSLTKEQALGRLHYILEKFISTLCEFPTTDFGRNLRNSSISDHKEIELIQKFKNITGCFAHGNTSTIEEQEIYLPYYDTIYLFLETLINKYDS